MELKAIPSNVYINKDLKPKGWSYSLKTTEIIDGLELAALPLPFHVHYDNSVRRGKSFGIFLLTYYGHMNQQDGEAFFHLEINTISQKLRYDVNEFIKSELFTVMRNWMTQCLKDERRKHSIVYIRALYHVSGDTKEVWVNERLKGETNGITLYEKNVDFDKLYKM